ncbi:MAG: FHIPEP family type III secretion protein [Nitrospirales bacterium]|nr:FHIPEP family type III secretion protein [Nitrospirales bacterium]
MSQETQMDPQQFTTKDTLMALDLPWSDELAECTAGIAGPDIWRHVSRLFTVSMARDCWFRWNPQQRQRIEDLRFLGHFRTFLAAALDLGYRLGRFREVSARLPDPDDGARNWIPLFEEIVAGDDCCTVRMFLSREQQQAFLASDQQSPEKSETWENMLSMMDDGLFYELGLVFRPVIISVDDALTLPWFRCEWNDLRLPPQRGLDAQHILVNDTVDRLTLLNIKGKEAVNPANGSECAIIDRSHKSIVDNAGLTTWDSRGYAVVAMSAAIRHAAAALVNRSLYQLYILRLREFSPDLVSVLESAVEPDFVVQVLRELLAEEISIRDLSSVLEGVLELRSTINVDMSKYIVFSPPTGGVFPDLNRRSASDLLPTDYAEFIRARLKRYISHKYTRGVNTLVVYLMHPHSEELLAKPNDLNVASETAIIKAVREEIGLLPTTTQSPVILTTMEVRRRLRKLVSLEFPHLAVLSYQELSPDINIQPIARISADLSPGNSRTTR